MTFENTKYESTFETIKNKLPLVNTDVFDEMRRSIERIIDEHWKYFRYFFDEYVAWVDMYKIEGSKIIVTVTHRGPDYCFLRDYEFDLRCFTDENFLKEKMNERF